MKQMIAHSRWLFLILLLLAACDLAPGEEVVIGGPPADAGHEDEEQAGNEPEDSPPPERTLILSEGRLVAVNPVLPLSFASAGRLLTIEVAPGDRVAAGELLATLDESALRDALTSAEMQLALAENTLAQAQLSLQTLLDWQVDPAAVALAEANLAAAEASYEAALAQDASAGNSLTSSRIALQQAQRRLAEAQEAYEIAFDPGREWELYTAEPSCLPGQGGSVPCTGPYYNIKLENERQGVERGLTGARESLAIAQANYNLAVSSLNQNSAVQAAAAVANAQQALLQAQKGPEGAEIAAADLRVEQAELSREQAAFSLAQAQQALDNARLVAPQSGEVLSVDAAVGSLVGSGLPIVTLFDGGLLAFHTTNLSERDLAQIAAGQSAEITLRTYPAQPVPGMVARVQPQASGQVGDAATFTVVIDVGQTELALLAGMTGRVEIEAVSEPTP